MEPASRPGETAIFAPPPTDAGLVYIGRIRTPWPSRTETPRQGERAGPLCRVEIFDPWVRALAGLEDYRELDILYWLHLARRDLVLQAPAHAPAPRGTFALRSPVRPNPIGLARVTLEAIEGAALLVRGLDCVDGTPLIDIKPESCAFSRAK